MSGSRMRSRGGCPQGLGYYGNAVQLVLPAPDVILCVPRIPPRL